MKIAILRMSCKVMILTKQPLPLDARSMSPAPALILARFVLVEARRSGLLWVVPAIVAFAIGLSAFISQVALTESAQIQVGVMAALFRMMSVFLTAAFVVTSVVREMNEKGTELLMSLPMSRSAFYLGKLAGYGLTGALMAVVFTFVLAIWADSLSVTLWGISLACETFLFAAVSLFFIITLRQTVPALAAVAGMYLLARMIATLKAISASPLVSDQNAFAHAAALAVDIVSVVLPSLDKVTQTSWLLHSPPSGGELIGALASLGLYCGLMMAAGLFDFHRRNL